MLRSGLNSWNSLSVKSVISLKQTSTYDSKDILAWDQIDKTFRYYSKPFNPQFN